MITDIARYKNPVKPKDVVETGCVVELTGAIGIITND